MPSRLCEGYRFLFSPQSVFESKSTDSHLDLTAGDGEGGAGGEAGDDGLGDEVDEEAEPEEVAADEDDDRHDKEEENKLTKETAQRNKPEVAADEDDDPREEGQQWSVVDSIRLNFKSDKLKQKFKLLKKY